MSASEVLDLITSVNQLDTDGVISSKRYEKVEASQPFIDRHFELNKGIFRFACNDRERIVFNKSYFKVRVEVTNKMLAVAANGEDPAVPNDIYLAHDAVNNMMMNMEVRCKGKAISTIADNVAPIAALNLRTQHGKSYLDGFLKDMRNFTDGGVNPDFIIEGAADANGTTKTFELYYVPPLSIFDSNQALPGEYEIILKPKAGDDLKLAALQIPADEGKNIVLGSVEVKIKEFFFKACMLDGPLLTQGTIHLNLVQTRCQRQQLIGSGNMNFDVSPVTRHIAIAYQDGRVERDARLSASNFLVYGKTEEKDNKDNDIPDEPEDFGQYVERFNFKYAYKNYPADDLDDKAVGGDGAANKWNRQRYYESAVESTMIGDQSGPESIKDYEKRGFYYLQEIKKPVNDRSTRLTVITHFANGKLNDKHTDLLVFDTERQNVQLKINSNGQVIDVLPVAV